jgi:hypothetical protein
VIREIHRGLAAITVAAALLVAGFLLFAWLHAKPQDLPWTPLDLGAPIGAATGRKLAGLRHDFPKCRALLTKAGVEYTLLPVVQAPPRCGYTDGVRLEPAGPLPVRFAPSSPNLACPVAAALAMWQWDVLQPAALRRFHARVVRIDHLGSYNCRHMYSRGTAPWSEHSTADAIDFAGVELSDGTRISVEQDWKGSGEKAAFLRDARDGACRLFSTVLSPDYNAAHFNHLHLDQAARGEMGWRACH